MMKRTFICAAAICAVGSVSSLASAAEPFAHATQGVQLANRNRMILSADRLFGFTGYSQVVDGNPGSTTSGGNFTVFWGDNKTPHQVPRLAFDYTVVDRVTVGGSFGLGFGGESRKSGPTTT